MSLQLKTDGPGDGGFSLLTSHCTQCQSQTDLESDSPSQTHMFCHFVVRFRTMSEPDCVIALCNDWGYTSASLQRSERHPPAPAKTNVWSQRSLSVTSSLKNLTVIPEQLWRIILPPSYQRTKLVLLFHQCVIMCVEDKVISKCD